MATTSEVENYPAIEKISGPEFSMNLYQQALAQGAEVRLEEVEQVSLEGEIKTVVTTQGTYTEKPLLLPTARREESWNVKAKSASQGTEFPIALLAMEPFSEKKK